jgi:hypothetical protein
MFLVLGLIVVSVYLGMPIIITKFISKFEGIQELYKTYMVSAIITHMNESGDTPMSTSNPPSLNTTSEPLAFEGVYGESATAANNNEPFRGIAPESRAGTSNTEGAVVNITNNITGSSAFSSINTGSNSVIHVSPTTNVLERQAATNTAINENLEFIRRDYSPLQQEFSV